MTSFQAYHLPKKDRDITQILADYQKKHGVPPLVLHVSWIDSESIVPAGLEVIPEQWVLPSNFFLEILEPLE